MSLKYAALLAAAATLLVASAPGASAAADVLGFVYGPASSRDAPASGVRVIVDGGAMTTLTRRDGAFILHNVSAGVHLLEFQSPVALVYPTAKVQVPDAEEGEIKVLEYRYPGAPRVVATHPLEVRPVAAALAFDERPSGSAFGFLTNPMVLIMVVTLGMTYCLPALQKLSDPDGSQARELAAGGGLGAMLAGVLPAQPAGAGGAAEQDAPSPAAAAGAGGARQRRAGGDAAAGGAERRR